MDKLICFYPDLAADVKALVVLSWSVADRDGCMGRLKIRE